MKTKKATVQDMVEWAKDNLGDKINDRARDMNNGGWSFCSRKQQKSFVKFLTRAVVLLALPPTYDSLKLLRKAGLWKGKKDNFWEEFDEDVMPPDDYKGQ